MPRHRRSKKSIFFEAIFIIGSLIVVGHLSVNFWEKYFLQAEMAEVKTSLNHLKKTIAKIGYAYDNLTQEMNSLTAHTITENNVPTVNTIAVGHKYKSKYTVDRRQNKDFQIKSVIASQKVHKWNPIYKENKTLANGANASATTNTNTKIAQDVSTIVSKTKVPTGAKSTSISKRLAAQAVTTNKQAVAKSTATPSIRPVAEISKMTEDTKPVSDAVTSITKPTVTEVCTVTIDRMPDSNAKSTITTNARSQYVAVKSTITAAAAANTRPDGSTNTSKLKAAEDAGTITRQPLKSTAAGLSQHQYEDCIYDHQFKHNKLRYHEDDECYRHECNCCTTLKF